MDFETIYRSHFQDVYRFICGLSADKHVAEEVTQESFFKALKAIDRFDGTQDIRAWLFTIAKNTYFSYCRKHRRNADETQVENTPCGISFVDSIIDEEQAFLIHQFLHQMPEPYKEVFTLRVFGELPFRKIGALFGKSDSWARVTFYRAKEKIIQHIKEVEHEGSQL